MIERIQNIWMAITYACNNKCSWCYAASDDPTNHHKKMELGAFKDYLSLFSGLSLDGLIFIGGEPTVHPQLSEMVSYAKSQSLRTGMVTNGRRLRNPDYCKTLQDAGLDHLTISIESADEAQHDYAVGVKGAFRDTIKGIENVLKTPLYMLTETTLSKKNADNIEELVDFLANLGMTKLGFNICTPCVSRIATSEDTLSPSEGIAALTRVYARAKERKISIESITPLPICLFDPELFAELNGAKSLHKTCYVFYGTNTVVDYNGDILPCVHFSGYPIMNLHKEGRVLTKEEFIAAYNDPSQKPAKFREELWKYPSQKCAGCDTWGKSCIGGCPMFWFKYNPEREITCKA